MRSCLILRGSLKGGDDIYGTASPDYIWGDWCPWGHGADTVYSYGGDDIVYLGDGITEYAYGGEGNDMLNGGDGDHDFVLGQYDDDILWGGPGTGDSCNGGSGDDLCHISCETRTNCQVFDW